MMHLPTHFQRLPSMRSGTSAIHGALSSSASSVYLAIEYYGTKLLVVERAVKKNDISSKIVRYLGECTGNDLTSVNVTSMKGRLEAIWRAENVIDPLLYRP